MGESERGYILRVLGGISEGIKNLSLEMLEVKQTQKEMYNTINDDREKSRSQSSQSREEIAGLKIICTENTNDIRELKESQKSTNKILFRLAVVLSPIAMAVFGVEIFKFII